jgi:predicted membrane-bound dolichyl-phosphate-mannose-protein mannosyltransferase
MESEVFCNGVAVGINLCQQKVIRASKRNEPLKIGDELYYVTSGRDRLKEMMERICT